MALYFECRINKNALHQAAFLAILPTGLKLKTPCLYFPQVVYHTNWITQVFVLKFRAYTQWAKSPKKVWRSVCLLIRHSNYSAILSKIVKNTLDFTHWVVAGIDKPRTFLLQAYTTNWANQLRSKSYTHKRNLPRGLKTTRTRNEEGRKKKFME